jgi:GT2 family glycosyltransferase
VLPSFSIVVPTYGRPQQLADCLASLAQLDYPRDRFEVIIVDDGGDVPLEQRIAPFRETLAVTLIRQPNGGPGTARNTGAERAGGEFIAFTDDDCMVETAWLRALATVLVDAPDCMVGGLTLNAADGICSTASQLIVDVVYRHYNPDPSRAGFVASNNMALSVRGFREVGGFDPTFRWAEDRDLCDRWRFCGRRIVYTATARVQHARPMNLRAFCRQHFAYGRGAARFHQQRSARRSGSLLVESRFHLDVMNWLWHPLTQVPLRQAPAVAALIGLWQTANLAGFVWEKVQPRKPALRDALSFSR